MPYGKNNFRYQLITWLIETTIVKPIQFVYKKIINLKNKTT